MTGSAADEAGWATKTVLEQAKLLCGDVAI